VAISADGRWAVSGASDQTLSLWSLAQASAAGPTTIVPTLTLFPSTGGEWVAWTPEGFFTASNRGAFLIGYSVNRGIEQLAHYVAVDQLYDRFYRPDLLLTRLQGDPTGLWQKKGALTDAPTVLASSGLPPQVWFVSPTADATMPQRDLDVQIALTDQGGGIGKVVWKLDGVTVGMIPPPKHAARVGAPAGPNPTLTLMHKLTLLPGPNVLEVTAYNAQNEVASTAVTLTLTLASPTPPPIVAATPSPVTPPTASTLPPVASLAPAAPVPTAPPAGTSQPLVPPQYGLGTHASWAPRVTAPACASTADCHYPCSHTS